MTNGRKTYGIEDAVMIGEVYRAAIDNTIEELNKNLYLHLFFARDFVEVHNLAKAMNIRYNEHGEIVREEK